MTLPCLNIVGRKSSIFPWEGCEVVGKLIRNCHTVRRGQWGVWVVHRACVGGVHVWDRLLSMLAFHPNYWGAC